MRIAILGAGFAGLSVAWQLLKIACCEVVLYDPKGIGGGASGIAAGLMHPYVGEEGKISILAIEGMRASSQLIAVAEDALKEKVANRDGIFRHTLNEEQTQTFISHCKKFKDVKEISERCFWIENGMTVDCPRYLEGLWRAIRAKGAILIKHGVSSLPSLIGFEHIIVAAGEGIAQFPELAALQVSLLKGQILTCRSPDALALPKKSSICKGYLALSSEKGVCHIGSTYERATPNLSTMPDPAVARNILFPKIALFFPEVEKLDLLDAKAALRVVRKGHYFPLTSQLAQGLWAFTAMGSRGLLYHAFLGELLAKAIYRVSRAKEPLFS
jgi:glycine/D-amino acid oxidase-like deaminating enzyme